MAEFKPAFDKMIDNEGGYTLHTVKGDRGGQTYAGIARKFHPDWSGWMYIDNGRLILARSQVYLFYREKFWNKIKGSDIGMQKIAETIFDFAVNAGPKTAVKLAQLVVDESIDGVIGPKTINALNEVPEEEFLQGYLIAKIKYYVDICNRDTSQSKFLRGWINRAFKGVE